MDPELEPFLPFVPVADLIDPTLERKRLSELLATLPMPDVEGLEVTDRTIGEVPVRIYRPREAVGAIVWLHGGGFCTGNLDSEHPWATLLAENSGAVVISVDYRLAPEHPFPAAFDDAYSVLTWASAHADELGTDRDHIAIGGTSAGASISSALCLRARDEQGPPIRFQLLNQPTVDDRMETVSAREFTDTPRTNRASVIQAWRHYLGGSPATAYSAAARATDLSGLPPAYIATAEFDPVRDEGIIYALRLLRSGVSVELHQWAGTFHGSQGLISAGISQRQHAEAGAALRRAMRT